MLNRCCNAQRFSGSEHALRPVNTAVSPRSAPVGSSLARRNVPSGKDQGETTVFAWSGFEINFFSLSNHGEFEVRLYGATKKFYTDSRALTLINI